MLFALVAAVQARDNFDHGVAIVQIRCVLRTQYTNLLKRYELRFVRSRSTLSPVISPRGQYADIIDRDKGIDQVRVTTTSWFAPFVHPDFEHLIPDKLALRDQGRPVQWLRSIKPN